MFPAFIDAEAAKWFKPARYAKIRLNDASNMERKSS